MYGKIIFHPITYARRYSSNGVAQNIKKSVFISQSKNIYANLALEDWLYRKFDFTNHHVLMLWQNSPCVVIGRHQNPWLEANITDLNNITKFGVKLARRNSGGGTVYHDEGNLNVTFFTPNELYNRKRNLNLISRALLREYGLEVEISKREDLMIDGCKISGTAAKLGRPTAYHHCTLLVDVNKNNLRRALEKKDVGIETNATQSIRSKIMNLCEKNRIICVSNLYKAIGQEFLRDVEAIQQNGFQLVNPTEEWFPGLTEIRDLMESWDWCYGKTPKFAVTRSFAIPDYLLNNRNDLNLKISIAVEQGRISDVDLETPDGLYSNGFSNEAVMITGLKGHKFSEETIDNLEQFGKSLNNKDKFVTDCIRKVMNIA